MALHQKGQFAQARASYLNILQQQPRHFDSLHLLGVMATQENQHQHAIELINQAIAIDAKQAASYSNRGVAQKALQQLEAALASFDAAIALKPDYMEAHNNRGLVLQELHQSAQAIASFDRAIAIQPHYAAAYTNRGVAQHALLQLNAALASHNQAITLQPSYAEAYSNRGLALKALGQRDAAIASFDAAVAIQPGYAEAFYNRGIALQEQQQLDAAIASFDAAITIRGDYTEAHWNKTLALLLQGNFERAWPLYERRWQFKELNLPARHFTQPLWLGEPELDGKTILLHSEQGLGDTLQFCRYAKRVAALGARVVMEVPAPLLALLQGLEGVHQWVAQGAALPAFDYHCPLLSLPLAFNTSLSSIPQSPAYLYSDASKVAHWSRRLGNKTQQRVGLVWSGSTGHKNDHNRSLLLSSLIHQLPVEPGGAFQFVSLQQELRDIDLPSLQAHPQILHFGRELKDFTDTAALCALMDVVISVDTSVAHLSGALGKPTWLLLPNNPDWRWLLNTDTSPWYPGMRLFRQPADGDWAPVLQRIAHNLAKGSSTEPPSGKLETGVEAKSSANLAQTLQQTDLQRALALQQQGQLAQAQALYQGILKEQPDHFDSLHMLGLIATQTQQHQRAVELIGQAIRVDPSQATAYSNIGLALRALKQTEAAITNFEKAIALKPDYAEAHYHLGMALQALGRLDACVLSYDRAIAARPNHAPAFFNRGLALQELKQFAAAIDSYQGAIALTPQNPSAHLNTGLALEALGQHGAAVRSYDTAIALQPDDAQAHYNRGNALQMLRQFQPAVDSYDQALAIKPDYVFAHYNRGNALKDLAQLEPAAQSFALAIAAQPDFAQAHYNLGNVLNLQHQYQAAVASFDKAIAFKPDHAQAFSNRGNALFALKQSDAALVSYERALQIDPSLADAWSNLGNLWADRKQFNVALTSYAKAIALQPSYVEALCNRGVALQALHQPGAAIESYDLAIASRPDYAQAFYNRGIALQEQQQLDAAISSFDQAIALQPGYAAAHWNLSVALLLHGDFDRGWAMYEWRWKKEASLHHFTQPLWLGEPELDGKTILLHSEQGLGDTLQFCRYAKRVAALGARVVMEVPAPLLALLQGLEGVHQWVAQGAALPAFDYHCPLLSLPLAFNTSLSSIPQSPAYLYSDASKVAHWSRRLGNKTQQRVGLVWSGSTGHKNDHNRSLLLSSLIHQLPVEPGGAFQFVSLQQELRDIDLPSLQAHPQILHFGRELKDFTDTAALCALMDVVISVDTSVAHLSGALGKPTWLLLPNNPDWRWLLNTDTSPWYPGMRLFRQPADGDWAPVLQRVTHSLAQGPGTRK